MGGWQMPWCRWEVWGSSQAGRAPHQPDAACSPQEISHWFRASAVGRIQTWTHVAHLRVLPVWKKLLPNRALSWSPKPSGHKAQAPQNPGLNSSGVSGGVWATQTSPHAACSAWESWTAVHVDGNHAPHYFYPWVLLLPTMPVQNWALEVSKWRSHNAWFLKVLSENPMQFLHAWHIDTQLRFVQLHLIVEIEFFDKVIRTSGSS